MKEIRRVLIWSGWLRVSHWSIALSTLILLVSGWLIEHSPMRALIALEYHYIAASILIFGLVVRVVIFIKGKEHERLAAQALDFQKVGNNLSREQIKDFYHFLREWLVDHIVACDKKYGQFLAEKQG